MVCLQKLWMTIKSSGNSRPLTTTTTAPIELMEFNQVRSVTSEPAIEHDQAFCRLPSQRRRRLWTLAARAAARRTHEKDLSSSKNLIEIRSSSLLAPVKPGTVRTQDSGISSMDYVTSREANSPNSEEQAGMNRPRANTSGSISVYESKFADGFRNVEVEKRPRCSTIRCLPPRAKIVVSGKEVEEPRFSLADHPCTSNTIRYTNWCSTYVPEWARRNWSSAPRPIIPRQRSSVEATGYDCEDDWASMETLNMQHALYPHSQRTYYGRYGRASYPKATFFDSSFNDPSNIHLEVANEMEEEQDEPVLALNPGNPSHHQEENPGYLRRRRKPVFVSKIVPASTQGAPLLPPQSPPPLNIHTPPLPAPRTYHLPPPTPAVCCCYRPDLPMHVCAYEQTSSHSLSPPNPIFHCSSCSLRYLPPGVPLQHHATPQYYPHLLPPMLCRQRFSHSLPQQFDLPQRHVRRRMLKRMSSEPNPPTWSASSFVEVPPEVPPHKRRAPAPEYPFPDSPPLPKRNVKPLATEHVYAYTQIIDKFPTRADAFLRSPLDAQDPAQQQQPPPTFGRLQSGLVRGRSVDDAVGCSLPSKVFRMVEPDWERRPTFTFKNDPLSCCVEPVGEAMASGCYPLRHRIYPHIHKERDVPDWNPLRGYVESAPGRINMHCLGPRLRKSAFFFIHEMKIVCL